MLKGTESANGTESFSTFTVEIEVHYINKGIDVFDLSITPQDFDKKLEGMKSKGQLEFMDSKGWMNIIPVTSIKRLKYRTVAEKKKKVKKKKAAIRKTKKKVIKEEPNPPAQKDPASE